MAHLLCIAQFSDLQFYVTYHAGVLLVTCCNSNKVDQIAIPKSSGFYELLIGELHLTPLACYLDVQKLTYAPF